MKRGVNKAGASRISQLFTHFLCWNWNPTGFCTLAHAATVATRSSSLRRRPASLRGGTTQVSSGASSLSFAPGYPKGDQLLSLLNVDHTNASSVINCAGQWNSCGWARSSCNPRASSRPRSHPWGRCGTLAHCDDWALNSSWELCALCGNFFTRQYWTFLCNTSWRTAFEVSTFFLLRTSSRVRACGFAMRWWWWILFSPNACSAVLLLPPFFLSPLSGSWDIWKKKWKVEKNTLRDERVKKSRAKFSVSADRLFYEASAPSRHISLAHDTA